MNDTSKPRTYPSFVARHGTFMKQSSSQSSNSFARPSGIKDEKQVPPTADLHTSSNFERTQSRYPLPPIAPRSTQIVVGPQTSLALNKFNGLESKLIRHAFVRKVYAVLLVQLLFTFGTIAIFHFTPPIRDYIRSPGGQWAYWTSYGVFLVTYITLACSKRTARRYPFNIILLSILTLSMTYMMSMISAYFQIESVFIAVGLTSFVCLGVTVFSFQSRFDFTSCVGILYVISLALMGFGFTCIFTYSRILFTVYAAVGAVVFSIFLAVDTQLIMGGKRHEISAEDHVYASLMLYLDIVYIFMYILMLFGNRE